MTIRKQDLKGCPLCGAKPFVYQTTEHNSHAYLVPKIFVECPSKRHKVQVAHGTAQIAFRRWNTRVAA